MKKTAYIFIVIGVIAFIYSFFLPPNIVHFFLLFISSAVIFLGFSFLVFPLPINRRKKIANIFLISSLVLAVSYYLFKRNHFIGANVIAFFIFYFFSFIFLPIYTKNRIEKWKHYTRKSWHAYFLSISDLASLAGILCGLLFRVLHWPMGNTLILTGVVILLITLLGWNRLFSQEIVLRKEAEEKVKEAFVELKEQHVIIEEKNKEILDSINYAKRLQDAILPSEKIWLNYLPNSFVLYQPKDIVAGDFYWMEAIGNQKAVGGDQLAEKSAELPSVDLILFAAADCTGHGVPGALVSVVCSNALNRTVKEFNITEPGKILDKVRELVIETFEKSENEVMDGMDISLCSLNLKTNELKWAGANNPLWYITSSENELKEIKANKQPIGKYAEQKPFTTHILKLNKGDVIYLFTDGYTDQFGGPKGKKFKHKQLIELLIQVSSLQIEKQKEKIESALIDWKGEIEQVDDICVIGIKF